MNQGSPSAKNLINVHLTIIECNVSLEIPIKAREVFSELNTVLPDFHFSQIIIGCASFL